MTFKDVAAADINNVFFNLDEFSDTHSVNGKSIPAMIDDMEHIERQKKVEFADGTYSRQILLYVKAADFGSLPAQGTLVELDGKDYFIADTTDESGVYTLTLQAGENL